MQVRTLQTKILITVSSLILVLGLTVVLVLKTALVDKLTDELLHKGVVITQHAGHMTAQNILTDNMLGLKLDIASFVTDSGGIQYGFVEDKKGTILAHSFKEGFPSDMKGVNPLEKHEEHSIQKLNMGGNDMYDIASPIMGGELGAIHLGFPNTYSAGINETVSIILAIIALVMVGGIVAVSVLSRKVTRPLARLVESADHIGRNNLDVTVPVSSNDEVGHLGATFNTMIRRLQETTVSRDELTKEVDERRMAEEELHKKRQELEHRHYELNTLFAEIEMANRERRKIMDAVDDMILLIDEEGIIKRANTAVTEHIQLPYTELIGSRWKDIAEQEEMQTVSELDSSKELYHKRTGLWYTCKTYPFTDQELKFSGSVMTLHNTTNIKRLTRQLESTNAAIDSKRHMLQSALDHISSLIDSVIITKDHNIRFDNPNIKKCYEIKQCGRDDCPCYNREAMRCWKVAGTFCGGEVQGTFAQKYGNCSTCCVYKEATTDPVYQVGEHFNNMMHILHTKNGELEKAYQELKDTHSQMLQKEKMATIGQLAAGVAHEINNPMGFIGSNLRSLATYSGKIKTFINEQSRVVAAIDIEDAGDEIDALRKKLKIDYILTDILELIDESLEGAERVSKIVQNLKSFSRIDEAEYKAADINECIESTLNIVWNELKYKATVNKEYGDIPLTKCFPHQLNQVFMNLLVNAGHAIDEQGEITIRTWNGDGHVNVSISDTGSGIPEDKRAKIFEPFFTTKPAGKGTGLGLSIAYDIIKKHNGDISLDSEVDKGTTFTLTIPVVEGQND